MVDERLADGLPKHAKFFVAKFKADIYPILYIFGMLDDKHIQKYLRSVSVEEIYKDALIENKEAVARLEQETLCDEERDVWKPLRMDCSPVKSPKEDGFVFRSMPLHDCGLRSILLKAISVKNGKLLIDESILLEASTIKPTSEQLELWDMLADFCERFNKKGLNKKHDIKVLFVQKEGGVCPNIYAVLRNLWIRKKGNVS